MYCAICSSPLRRKTSQIDLSNPADIAHDWHAKGWNQRGNLKVCWDCIERVENDPWEIIEEVINSYEEELTEVGGNM